MSENYPNTAILVFALNPDEEMHRKQIRKGGVLFSALSKHTISEVRKTKLPFVHYGGAHQRGASFGERFTNAIADLFDQGFQNVVTLGNDCPQLTHKHILQAIAALSYGKNVIAPSLDGGFNLLGIQKSAFKKEAFQQLAWQKKQLYTETIRYFEHFGHHPIVLEAFTDIDHVGDISRLLCKIRSVSFALYHIFNGLLQHFPHSYPYSFLSPKSPFFSLPFNKGSPFPLS